MQFTLRRVWLIVTLLCLILAIPGIAVVGFYVSVWVMTGLVIVLGLVLLQLPAFLILRSVIRSEKTER